MGRTVILDVVYELLRVLNANTDSEGLGLEKPSVIVEKGVDVAGGMTCGEEYGCAFKLVTVGACDACDFVICDNKVGDSLAKMNFSAVVEDCLTYA